MGDTDMTDSELKQEWEYRFDERAALLAEDRDLTPQERNLCRREANSAILALTSTPPEHDSRQSPAHCLRASQKAAPHCHE